MFGINKYIIGAVAMLVVLIATFFFGYFSHNNVKIVKELTPCSEFRKHVVSGPETDKVMLRFQRNGLCS